MKIHLGMPVFSGVHPNVVQNLIGFDIDSQKQKNELCTQFVRGSLISQNRNFIMRTALVHNDDWVLMWDADVEVLDRGFLQGMIETSYKFNAPVVGLAVKLKTGGSPFNCGRIKDGGYRNYTHLRNFEDSWEVDAVGTGCMLINLNWIKKNIPSAPWFSVVDTETGAFPEDWHFCELVKQKGGTIYVDPRFKTRHFGEYGYE